jgi:hypothetical protein
MQDNHNIGQNKKDEKCHINDNSEKRLS